MIILIIITLIILIIIIGRGWSTRKLLGRRYLSNPTCLIIHYIMLCYAYTHITLIIIIIHK